MYAMTNKQADVQNSFKLLRKGQRLEKLLPQQAADVKGKPTDPQTEPTCSVCATQVSPWWYERSDSIKIEGDSAVVFADRDVKETLCHQCHFAAETATELVA